MNKKHGYRPQTTKIPGSDLPAIYYTNLVSKAFMAYLATQAELGICDGDELYFKNLCSEFGQILDFLAENLEL